MKVSFVRVIFIVFFAVILALLINFLQPNSLPLINNNNNLSLQDQNFNNPPMDTVQNTNPKNNLKQDRNKIAVEKSTVKINEDLLPEYNYSNDSSSHSNQSGVPIQRGNPEINDPTLNSISKGVFNQPRLISLTQAYELYKDKIQFVDARDIEQFEEGHIAGAINLPYFSMDEFFNRLDGYDRSTPIVTYCEGIDCDMSIRLGNALFSKGFKKVFVFFGGWEEWEKSGYPVVGSTEDIELN